MSKYWSRLASTLEPYIPGEQPKDKTYIKLNTNENPYPPSPQAIAAMQQAADADLRLYPTPTCDELRASIAETHALTADEVFVGNGSDEVLAFSFLAFFNPGAPILFPDITYSFYPVYASLFQIDYQQLPLQDDFSLTPEDYFVPNGGVIFPNPNAPTGRYLPLAAVEAIIRHNENQVVIVDEAYIDFGGESAAKLVRQYPNLLVIQTYSKSRSLAGLRVGFALGQPHLIEGLDRVKNSINSYTLDRIALAGALASWQDTAYFQDTCQRVMATRDKTVQAVQAMGFTVVPSLANFIFIKHAALPAAQLFSQLKERGILVRYFKKPRIDNYLRVSIGSEAEMETFVKVVRELVDQV